MSDESGVSMTLVDHLTELRDRLIKSAYGLFVGGVICWIFHLELLEIVTGPIRPHLQNQQLIFTNPIDAFMAGVKLAVTGGIIISSPIWLYQVWRFVAPGLYAHEKKYSALFVGTGVGLFLTGVCFVYFLVLPMAFRFLLTFAGSLATPMITISEYLSFFVTMSLVFGCAFELPLALVILGLIGLVDDKTLREKRRFAIVGLAVFSAVVTPPDAMSMIMMLVPLIVLYEISILAVSVIVRRRNSSSAEFGRG